jgi:hypothetical protein
MVLVREGKVRCAKQHLYIFIAHGEYLPLVDSPQLPIVVHSTFESLCKAIAFACPSYMLSRCGCLGLLEARRFIVFTVRCGKKVCKKKEKNTSPPSLCHRTPIAA